MRPPIIAPENLPMLATTTSSAVRPSKSGRPSTVKVRGQPGHSEEHGHEEGRDQSAKLLVDVTRTKRCLPDENPRTNAPSTVCTPMAAVSKAITPMMTRAMVTTGSSLTKASFAQRISCATTRLPTVKLKTRNKAVPSTLRMTVAASIPPGRARPKTMAMVIHPMVSSMMAEATITCPTVRRMNPISRTSRATIFTDEIDSATPMNRAVTRRLPGSGNNPAGSHSVNRNPQTKGTAIPAMETLNAARRVVRTTERSASMPVSISSNRTPNCATASSMARCCGAPGKELVLEVWQQRAEDGGSQEDPGKQLAHDRGLPDSLQQLAQQPPGRDQQDYLREEQYFRYTVRCHRPSLTRQSPDWFPVMGLARPSPAIGASRL